MDRLTGRDKTGVYYRHGKENGVQPYADRPQHESVEAIERLADYEDAEEQGLLHKAPIPNGTPIYRIHEPDEKLEPDMPICIVEDTYIYGYTEYELGEQGEGWHLTRDEAEAALKGGAYENKIL